jgi:hypothetical protein
VLSKRFAWTAGVAIVVILALVLLAVVAAWRGAPAPSVPPPTPRPVTSLASFGAAAAAPSLPARPSRAQLLKQYRLAEHTLCSYERASQYPPGSRPMAQNPDQAYPNRAVLESNPMRLDGGGLEAKVTLQTAQSRVYMATGETATFSLRAVDTEGSPVPLVITRAAAGALQPVSARDGAARPLAEVALAFADDGQGAMAGVLAPAQTGLASFDGTIRTQVEYAAGGKSGMVSFDVVYSPVTPAVWTGAARTAQAGGALEFYLPADVRVAGRYVVTGRVDDAAGVPFALLTFNDVLPVGQHEVRLAAFGKLLRDGAPALPLTLRDVDGYLLRENTSPDRALMPRLPGAVATSGADPLSSFSAAPYDGEERRRYLAEFSRDVARARGELLRDDPVGTVPASSCVPVPSVKGVP